MNTPYLKLRGSGRPWVILKWAQSLDGKIATRTGHSKWISDEAARAHAHRTRGRVDAILVGIGTALRDDPLLTARLPGGRVRRVATRIVLDSRLRLPLSSRLARTAGDVPTWVFAGRHAPPTAARRLERAGCRVLRVRSARAGLSLPGVLDALGRAEMTNLLVEGGGHVLGAFFDAGLADEIHAYIAPRLIGGEQAVSALHGRGVARVEAATDCAGGFMRKLGNGWLCEARLARHS